MSVKTTTTAQFIVLGLLMLGFTFIFKWQTGSFITISEEAKKEVLKYELQKRKGELSIKSLKESCFSVDDLNAQIRKDLEAQNDNCSLLLIDKFSKLSGDSAYYKSIVAVYEYASFYETKITENQKILRLSQDKNPLCEEAVLLIFEKDDHEEYLLKNIKNFAKYYSCTCGG